jgi:hypothetical protein
VGERGFALQAVDVLAGGGQQLGGVECANAE